MKVFAFNEFANCLAINVLPVPGGPYNKIPLTCFIPNFYTNECGRRLDAKALLNRFVSWVSNPPIPSAYKEKFLEKTFF